MEEKIFMGYNYGRFKNDAGNMQDYCNAFVLEDFSGTQNEDYCYGGQKAMKYGCVSPNVFAGIPVGSRVLVSFNSKNKISYMKVIDV